MAWTRLCILIVLLARAAAALDFATTSGPYLINNATRGTITINGIWYSLSNSTTDINAMDSLKDADACRRDAALMAELGINTIYVMAIDPGENHDDCFSVFNSVGIYIIITLRKEAIFKSTYTDLASSYAYDFLEETFKIIDAVKDYQNLLGFDFGLLPSMGHVTSVAPDMEYPEVEKFYRALIRDSKEFIAKHAPRPILVGITLGLDRTDWPVKALNLTQSHLYWFSCRVNSEDEYSTADYVSFWNLGLWRDDPLGSQTSMYLALGNELQDRDTHIPTWFSMYGVSALLQELRPNESYERAMLSPDLVDDTLHLYNSASGIVQPSGIMSGGARFTWTNRNLGWKVELSNWGIVTTDSNGDVQLTENYERLRDIFGDMSTESWLNGDLGEGGNSWSRSFCDADMMRAQTAYLDFRDPPIITIATDWALPTRPAGVDALVTNGVNGKRGQMVDVVITTILHTIKDSKGNRITSIVLKPTKSEPRTPTGTNGNSPSTLETAPTGKKISRGVQAGIGVAAGVGSLAVILAIIFALLRRSKLRKQNRGSIDDVPPDNPDGYSKAELATGPGVEKIQVEVCGKGRPPRELHAFERYAEAPGAIPQPRELPAELPVELPVDETILELAVQEDVVRESGR